MKNLFCIESLRKNRRRSMHKFYAYDFLHRMVMNDLKERLALIKKKFQNVLFIGVPSLAQDLSIPGIVTMDIIPDKADVCGSAQWLAFAEKSFDLILCPLSLHVIDDLPGALIQIKRALKPDGVFMTGMMGGESLCELRAAIGHAEITIKGGISPRVAPMIHLHDMAMLMQRAQFALPVVDSHRIPVTYENPIRLVRDLRGMGEGNPFSSKIRTPLNKALLHSMTDYYREHFSEQDGRILATFDIIYACGWSPHESQPKPLRPGSAQKSIADALGTYELSAGEKAAP